MKKRMTVLAMCLTLQVWKMPSITTKTAPIDFETKCPNVRTGQRAALMRCRSFAFPYRTAGGVLSV